MPKITLGQRLNDAQGRPSGFDYMRLVLAILVVVLHAPWLTYGNIGNDMVWRAWFTPAVRLVIPMFFALSGFLIAASFERSSTLFKFFGLRIIRIAPALMAETVLSALILGPLLTEYTFKAYVSDPLFRAYFLNMLGEPQYLLPGLFAHSPNPEVNAQLWTIPFELACYVSIAVVGLLGGRRKAFIAPLAMVGVILAYLAARVLHWHAMPDIARPMPGPLLIAAFLAGVTAYLYRERLSASHATGLALVLASLVLLGTPGVAPFLAPLPVAWLTAYLGTLNPVRIGLLRGADYSYGLYLYGLPIEQALIATFPDMRNWMFTAGGALVLGGLFAAFSWHYVEKPALKLRGVLERMEKRWVAWFACPLPHWPGEGLAWLTTTSPAWPQSPPALRWQGWRSTRPVRQMAAR